MATRTQFSLLTGVVFVFSMAYPFLPVEVSAYLFFFLFLLVGGYTIYLFLGLESQLPVETRSRYYDLVGRVVYIVVTLYFLIFSLALEKIWRVLVTGDGVNLVFMAVQSFLSFAVFLIAIWHVDEQAGFVEEHFYHA